MERMRVKSGTIRTIGYDESEQILEIELHHGGAYQYFGVPIKIYDGLMNAQSSYGQYLTRYIKNRYRHKKLS